MVMHWNTVSIAKAKLSKLVMPPFGPTQPLLHSVPLAVHWRPFPENAHGAGSSSATISANKTRRLRHSQGGGGTGKTSTSGNRVLLQILKHPSLLCQAPICSTNSTSHVFCKISHPLLLIIHCPLFYPLPLSILTGLGVILGDTQSLLLSLCIRISPGRIPGGI